MLKNEKQPYIISILLFALVAGIYIGYMNTILCLLLTLLLLFWMNNSERSIFLLLFGKHWFGILFQFFQIPIPGSVIALGLAILFSWKFTFGKFIQNPRWVYMLYVLAICSAYYFLGTHTEYANQKYVELFTTGICMFFVYSLFSQDSNISPQKISMAFVLYAMFLFAFAFDFFAFPHPSSITDVSFYRDMCMTLTYYNESAVGLSYQEVGMAGLLSFAFWVSNREKLKISDVIIILLIAWITLLSGSRQAIFGIIILSFVWSVVRMRKITMAQIITSGVVVASICVLMLLFQTDNMNESLMSGGTLDERLGGRSFASGLKIFFDHSATGCGFGLFERFDKVNGYQYPHNIFIEILSEMGLLGFILLMTPVLIFISKNRIRLRDKYANGSCFFVIFMAYFIRANISGSLGENIVLFAMLFAFVPLKFNNTVLSR